MEKNKKASKYAYDGKKDWSNTWPTRGEKRRQIEPARLSQGRGSSDDDAGNMFEEHNCQHPLEPTLERRRKPYAVRYKEDDNDTNRPTDNGRQTVGISPNDDDIRPYAVAYMCQDDTVVVRGLNSGQTQHKTKTASNRSSNDMSGHNSSINGTNDMWSNATESDSHTHDTQPSSSARHLHPMYLRLPQHPNPIKMMPNLQYAPGSAPNDHPKTTSGKFVSRMFSCRCSVYVCMWCEYRRVCVAIVTVIILVSLTFGGTFAVLYFNTTGRDVAKPTPAVDTNCTRGDTVCHGYGQETMADLSTMSTPTPAVDTNCTRGDTVCHGYGQETMADLTTMSTPTLAVDTNCTRGDTVCHGYGQKTMADLTTMSTPTPAVDTNCTRGDTVYHGGMFEKFVCNAKSSIPENPDGGANSTITFGGPGSAPGTFLQPRGVAISADNEIFVSDTRNVNKRVQVFNMGGDFLRLFKTVVPAENRQSISPHDVAIDEKGRVWVVGHTFFFKSLYVVQYSQNGQPVTKFEIPCSRSNDVCVTDYSSIDVGKEKSFWPILTRRKFEKSKYRQWFTSVTSDMEGKIYVTDSGVSKVKVYNSSGHFLLSFGDGLSQPRGICVAPSGHIIVANLGKGRIDMFNSTGEFVRTVVKIAKPWGTAVGPNGQLVVTSEEKNTVSIFPRQLVYPE
ncbi:PREDICTED: uncharacterized protein LOC109473370 [Branchiostoma belcheri]|uniref:Uncharacterized protein LOC109473370 n=1 Tax=Branchiostoma belcheri TaxID=7741 RepID=A0A6P4ZGK2_BRABE|nr:PREDICTED: uncharacterized protein LOC109473370 [Branchiostoma belcheri]